MYLSKVQYKALKYLRKHGYVTYQQMSELKRFKNKRNLEDAISFLYNKELINYYVPSSRTARKYEAVDYFDFYNHLSATEFGHSVVDERKRGITHFWLPYSITTLIAIANLIAVSLSVYYEYKYWAQF